MSSSSPALPDGKRSSDTVHNTDTEGSPAGTPSQQPPPPPDPPMRSPRGTGPRRHATHNDCVILRNSLRFRHEHPHSFGDSDSSTYGDGSGSNDMEVMDLRPSSHQTVRHMENSSLVSVSSHISLDSELASGLFQVASGTSGHGGSGLGLSLSSEGEDAPLGDDLPQHWQTASERTTTSMMNDNLFGESEQSYRTLMSTLMHSIHSNNNGEDNCSTNTGRSGAPDSSSSGGSTSGSDASCNSHGRSKVWDHMESSSKSTTSESSKSSPSLRDRRRLRRKVYVRRCAKAMVGIVALAALSGSVIYFSVEENRESMSGFFPDNDWLDKWFGNDNNSKEQQEQKDYQLRLRYRKLPQGGNVVEMVSTPQEYQGNDNYDMVISPQERTRRLRAQRIRTQEQLVREQQELRAEREYAARRRTTNNGVPQYHRFDDERWNNNQHQQQQYHEYNYNRYPFIDGSHRALAQEDQVHYNNVHQDHYHAGMDHHQDGGWIQGYWIHNEEESGRRALVQEDHDEGYYNVHQDDHENFVPQDGVDHQDDGWIQGWWRRV
mmetsp:Transcript_183/g.454  ORF Transcript_183/g.454 Transcript_183/m.454 type:complete len:547 (+) Transcript_183:137-1777(+)|eukprot:CAMPEP_0202014282 /NCGR_PEP_ID=MMETSP0905-20130828/28651_1 /ASSEMBLY_ACC=CAM_ASM_000554 /TAXON_ID=420261 /ORGANISM="Thalassiosira antarctica, Strain CCMP982" /LENGTH=546 /DNA_ID=CAMNT_0048574139 /DNA_START=79 /DNA_END=1719 /DNA_ORIENTATION=+